MKHITRAFVVVTTLAACMIGLQNPAIAAPTSSAVSSVDTGDKSLDPGAVAKAQDQMSQADFDLLRKRLDAPDSGFVRSEKQIPSGTEFTYTHASGVVLAMDVPSSPVASSDLRAGGCGFLKLCIYFNRTDQAAIIAGGSVAVAGAICAIPAVGTIGCTAAAAVVAAAVTYLTDNGRCKGELRAQIFPVRGGRARCV